MTSKYITLTALLLVLHPSDYPTDLVVHEWGTFTTLASSDGTLLNGLYLDEEPLPRSVNQIWPVPPGDKDVPNGGKGLYFQPAHVNVKMETPVLYFYSPRSLPVSVRVDFPRGLISQWYPSCTSANQPTGPLIGGPGIKGLLVKTMDFASPAKGFMEWKARVLAPGSSPDFTIKDPLPVWNTPRLTDANLLSVRSGDDEQIEKFIFYRGVANFTPPITAKFVAGSNASMEITNTGSDDLPFVFAYEKTKQSDAWLYWQGSIQKGQHHVLDRKVRQKMTLDGFEKALIDAGLYPKEARAMLNTWKKSYFDHEGIRIFWIAPKPWVNSILPLKITPQPKQIQRVFVGRYELLSPEFERALRARSPGSIAANDRYHLAYEDFLRHAK